MAQRLNQKQQQTERVQENEREEELVVAIAETIVYERAMMVEKLNAFVANGAVEACLTLYNFAIWTEVIKMETYFKGDFHQFCEVVIGS